jgi:hypothetical protein
VANKNFTVKNGLEVGGQEVISSSGAITSAALGGQVLGTSASPSFANITTAGYLRGPASFVIDPAAHGDDTGTVVIAGNLQVDGTQTTINSTTMTVDDLNLNLASGAANAAAADGAGLTIDGAGTIFAWSNTLGSMTLNKELRLDNNKGLFFANAAGTATVGLKADTSDNITFRQNGSWDRLVIKNTGVDVSGNIVVSGTVNSGGVTSTVANANPKLKAAYNSSNYIGISHEKINVQGGGVGLIIQGNGVDRATFASGGGLTLANGTLTTPTLITGAYGGSGSAGDGFRLNSTDLYGQIDSSDKVRLTVNGDSFLTGGNLGIGTPSPAHKLDVLTSTDQQIPLRIKNSDGDSNTYMRFEDNSGQYWDAGINYANNDYYLSYGGTLKAHFTNAGGLNINGTGNSILTLNIGTTAGNYSALNVGRTDGAGTAHITPAVTGGVPISGTAGILLGSTNSSIPAVGIQTPNSSNGHIVFKPKGTEKVRITADGEVGIGTSSPETGLHLYGTSNVSSNFTIEQVYSGTSKKFGFQPVYNDDRLDIWYNSNATSAITIKDGGNVGIGTTTPGYKLDVSGTGRIGNTLSVGDGPASGPIPANTLIVRMGESSTTGGPNSGNSYFPIVVGGGTHLAGRAFGIGFDPEGYGNRNKVAIMVEGDGQGYSHGKLHFAINSAVDSQNVQIADSKMTILKTGNVGIGTASPGSYTGIQSNLEVKSSTHGGIAINAGTNSLGMLAFAAGGTHRWSIESENSATPFLAFNEAGTYRLAIDHGGNVGIGTTSPNSLLELRKTTAGFTTSGTGNKGAVLTLHHEAQWESAYGTGGSTPDWLGAIDFSTGDGSAGEGIRASIRTTVNNYYNTNDLAFYTANQGDTTLDERMRIKENGNVGIGTATPSSKLTVINSTATDGNNIADFVGSDTGQRLIVANFLCGSDEDRVGLYWENQGTINMRMWMADTGNLYLNSSNPSNDTDGSRVLLAESNGNTIVGTQIHFNNATNSSFIGAASTVNLRYAADGYHRFDTYNGGWGERVQITDTGCLPGSDSTYDLGSPSLRWANVYTGDLHLSNEEKGGNEVDGTTGNWTIQEGDENLYIKNNKTGKKYKFALEEIV